MFDLADGGSTVNRPAVLSDAGAAVMAIAAAVGAWWAAPVSLVGAVAVSVAAALWRRQLLIVLAAAALTSALAARSWAGLAPPMPQPWAGTVSLVSDPERISGATHLVVRARGERWEIWARGDHARALRPLLAGDRVFLTGQVTPLPVDRQRRLGAQHIVGRLAVAEVGARGPTPSLWRAANGVRGLLARGSVSLPAEQRALLAGLVLGDDRGQSAPTKAAYRAAGLTHLLAVSGQNVAFVLAVASPLLKRLTLRVRWVTTVSLLAFFAVVTRFEPSVIRATLMAGLAVTAALRGRPTSSVRLLCLASTVALVIDPLLVHQVGFQLSVLATAGIVTLSGRIAAKLPGPRPLALAAGVTIGAQTATAPLLIGLFGGVPLVALPANLLAEPAAGAAMTYGLGAGLLAGVLGGRAAALLHLPTRLLLSWIDLVAHQSARSGLGNVAVWHVVVAGACVVMLRPGGRAALRYLHQGRRCGEDGDGSEPPACGAVQG